MSVNLKASRREYFHKCYWYKNDKANRLDRSQLEEETDPSGIFYAKEENSISTSNNVVSGVFQAQRKNITISTEDFVDDLKPNDIVLFDEDKWIVTDIQLSQTHKEEEFSHNTSYKAYIGLRR